MFGVNLPMQNDDKATAEKMTRKTRLQYERFKEENPDIVSSQNEAAKAWLLDPTRIDCIAKALTQFIFRDGPVEDVHGKSKALNDEAMKEINIYMVNHIAGILSYIHAGNWVQLVALICHYNSYCNDWHPAEPDTSIIDFIFYEQLKLKK